mgnify:CR=1 FL=1
MPIKLFIFLFFYFLSILSFGQTKQELEEKKKIAREELNRANELLHETRSNKQNTVYKLYLVNKKISLRNEIITAMGSEINRLNSRMSQKMVVLDMLKNDLDKIRNNYADLIRRAYVTNRTHEKLMFIFASNSFNQAYKRLKYLQQYYESRKQIARIIEELSGIIESETKTIQNTINQRNILLIQRKEEKQELEKDKIESNESIKALKMREKLLLKEIAEKKKIAENLEREILRIIEEEAIRARSTTGLTEFKMLNDGFIKNKGNMNWPVRQSIVINDFGKHQHPVLKNVYIENNGIDISTVKGSSVRPIFDGIVSRVFAIKGSNSTVIIRHGNYLTIYQNLINVLVKTGQVVTQNDIIGEVYFDQENNASVLHFEIWHELNKLNPSQFLSKK